jgi:UDP-glucose 6-dehydrogenase
MADADTHQPIGVIGAGYVGLVTAAGFAELGSEVWCVDIDAGKIARLKAGEVPIHEPGLAELLARNRERLHFSTELSGVLEHARLLFVAVGTPSTYSGDADLSAVHAVVAAIPPAHDRALVMKSTVPCGTGAALQRSFREQGKQALGYVSCPEFLREGSAVEDFLHPDRVVVGADDGWAGDAVVDLYAPLGAPIVRTDVASAEMVKLASNAFLATKISFINEIANVCEETGADVVEVARGMGLDERIGPRFLQAGIGYGGSCFAPDETVLARHDGRVTLRTFSQLWDCVEPDADRVEGKEATLAYGVGSSSEVLEPRGVEVLSWVRGETEPRFMPVMALTRRPYDGDLIAVATKMGRRLRTTPDHPWLVGDGESARAEVKLAFELTTKDLVPAFVAAMSREDLQRISGAAQDERAIAVVPECDRAGVLVSMPRQRKRIAPTGYRRLGKGPSWVRITGLRREAYAGDVYSLEVPGSHTVVTSGGLTTSNCFPKDVEALKQLAGNSGYHFQLLTAVIEVNELQKRRVIAKLQKHLGELPGKRVALFGLAFKPHTDDMREASSLVLAARLNADGARVTAYDPVAEEQARELVSGISFASSALDAATDADAVVLVTEWPEFLELDWRAVAQAMAGNLVIDGRNALDPEAIRAAGLVYEGIGRLPRPRDAGGARGEPRPRGARGDTQSQAASADSAREAAR